MSDAGVHGFVFSSTCAVYGDPDRIPITEEEKKAPVSPYGRSKWMVEQILQDYGVANKQFKDAAMRYFNASGCAICGTLVEDPDAQTHLIPVLFHSIAGHLPALHLF